ncbi:MAG: DUF1302 domain-containing protein [Oceanospirillales bacterium]|nr:DUF1302 domain-containing protein [Oceanospirillales bacterium]
METKNGIHTPQGRRPFLVPPTTLALLISAALAPTAQAVQFNLGDIEGRFDSQLSVGASWRLSDQDADLISVPNGGRSNGSGSYDDGDLNFEQGDIFSRTFKGVHELDLRRDNIGLFMRGKYWFDFALEDDDHPHGNTANGYAPNSELSDSGFNDYARFTGAELLDAYLYGSFDLGSEDQYPLDVRLGRQVVNWGESAFVQGGLNSISPLDVSAIRRPGAEIKDALLPTNQLFASLGLTYNLSVEGFYQLSWEPTAIDGCGTYFSTNDFAAQGCNGIRVPLGLTDEQYFNTAFTGMALGFDPVVYRNEDGYRPADDDGQFGVALRYFAENLNSTEFGFYLTRYHSRLPISSGVNTPVSASDLSAIGTAAATQYIIDNAANPLAPTPAELAAAQSAGVSAATAAGTAAVFKSTYFSEYPEDIAMLGLSFNTNLGDVAWSGEVSFKHDQPIQINGPLLVTAILTQFSGGSGNSAADQRVADAGPGGTVSGYDRFDVTQVQTSFVKFYDRVLGASRLALIGELGWTHVHGLDEGKNALKYGRPGAYGYTAGDDEGFVTADSFGYVARAALTYPNALAGFNLTPQVSLKHGLKGYGPEPGSPFREGEKALGLTLTADYLNRYQFQAGYTTYFGGDYNALSDRDYFSLSASVSF